MSLHWLQMRQTVSVVFSPVRTRCWGGPLSLQRPEPVHWSKMKATSLLWCGHEAQRHTLPSPAVKRNRTGWLTQAWVRGDRCKTSSKNLTKWKTGTYNPDKLVSYYNLRIFAEPGLQNRALSCNPNWPWHQCFYLGAGSCSICWAKIQKYPPVAASRHAQSRSDNLYGNRSKLNENLQQKYKH